VQLLCDHFSGVPKAGCKRPVQESGRQEMSRKPKRNTVSCLVLMKDKNERLRVRMGKLNLKRLLSAKFICA
jgi:hypothetical protein